MTSEDRYAPDTLCVHAGHRATAAEKAIVAPTVRSTTFLLDDEAYALRAAGRAGEARIYARETNPTIEAVERRLAALEGAERVLVFSSGMAAMQGLLLAVLERGDHVVTSQTLYGGTRSLLDELVPRLGVDETTVALDDAAAVEAALRDETKLLLCESIANPTIAVADLPRLAELAHARGALLAVDATFATPIAQRPLALGADVVHHSATKYLGGHSDLIGGALGFGAGAELASACWQWRTRAGGCMDPAGAALLDRGLKTLGLRMRAHSANAVRIATFLDEHPKVERVFYPTVPAFPSRAVAERVLALPSGMLSFVVPGGDEGALRFVRGLELVLEAASLGGVESTVSLPFNMSHSHFNADQRLAMGIPSGLVRLSVGIEDVEDLIADLAQALDRP